MTVTIREAIALLEAMRNRHGSEVEVYFDCPVCAQAFTPSTLVAQALHLTAEKKK